MAILDYIRQFVGEEPVKTPVYRVLRVTDEAGFPKTDDYYRRLLQCTFSDVWFSYVADSETKQILPVLFMQYCTDELGYPKDGFMHTSLVDGVDEDGDKIRIKTRNSVYYIRRE